MRSAGGSDPVLGQVRLIDGLAALDGEPVLVRTSANAFTTTSPQQLLAARGIRDLPDPAPGRPG